MRIDILTIFPDFFTSVFHHGVLRRAIAQGQVMVTCHDLRNFTHDRHRTVDDRPFGGGEGMVLKPEPITEAIESLGLTPKGERNAQTECVILLSAQGIRFTQAIARELAKVERLILICGRYEGVDERIYDLHCDRELSIGDYVLSGGELGAAVIVDAAVRLLPGVLGNEASTAYESFGPTQHELQAQSPREAGTPPSSTHGAGGLLDYPHYTRPAVYRGLAVPDVLTGGNHDAIRRWRREQALKKTLRNRPDLLENAELTEEDRRFLAQLREG